MPLIFIAVGLVILQTDPLPLRILQNNIYDQYQRWHPREYVDSAVRIIDIDEESLKKLGQWPWPRTFIAELIEKLHSANVAAIGLDIIFAEPDRTSPQVISELWALDDSLRLELKKLPNHDKVLTDSLNFAGVILGFSAQNANMNSERVGDEIITLSQTEPARPFRYIFSGIFPEQWAYSFNSAITSLPEFERVADGNGALNFIPDGDGIVRRVPLVFQVADKLVPGLAAEVLRVVQKERNFILKTENEKSGFTEIKIGALNIPTTAQGDMWIHYTRNVPSRYISAWKLLNGEIPGELLDGQVILIGSSAQGLMDLRFTPLGLAIPGVEIHAQAIEQILLNHYLQQPDWGDAVVSVVMIIGGLIIGYLTVRTKALISATSTLICMVVLFVISWISFRHYNFLLDTATPIVIFTLIFIFGSLIQHYISELSERWIKDAFSHYVSPNRVEFLVNHPESLKLGGYRHECSFIFTDLAGFTRLMESIDPIHAMAFLNTYIEEMVAIAFRYEGTLDRIVGDAVAIMFSAPVQQQDHHARALACALEMDEFASYFSDNLNSKGIPFGKTRLGIHTGDVVVGNFGGSTFFDYRALGDTVNTAARLENVNKFLGTSICVSEITISGCVHDRIRPIGRLVLKGKENPLKVYEPIVERRAVKYAPLDEYVAAYDLMEAKDISFATRRFDELMVCYPDDPLVKLHSKRLAEGATDELIRDRRK